MPEDKDIIDHYRAVPFSLKQFAPMEQLFQSAFKTKITHETFLKRFDTSAFGNDVIGYLAIHRQTNTPAAYYGVFPVRLYINGKIVLAAQSGDTMTHEKHRKRGLFIWLAKMTFNTCREKGVSLVFGMPNKNSYPGFINRLNWTHLDAIDSYDLKSAVRTIPLAKLFLKFRLFDIYLKFAKAVLRKYTLEMPEGFLNPLENAGKVFRDTNYLSYKQTSNKLFLKVGEVKLWVSLTDVFWIGDFDNYEHVAVKTINSLKHIAWMLGYNTIRFNFNANLPKPAFLQFFKKQGSEPSCFFYIDREMQGTNVVLTAADFDTW